MSAGVSVEVVTARERLDELEPGLRELFARDPFATPFQSPAWLLPWLDCFAPRAALRSVIARSGDRLVAWLPLMIWAHDGVRSLVWVGDGVSDYLDAVVDRAAICPFPALSGALRELAAEVDEVRLNELPDGSPNLELWLALGALQTCSVCPGLELHSALVPAGASLPRWLVRNVRQTEQRASAAGPLRWALASAGDGPELLDAFFELHGARWRARGQPGVLADAAVRSFHRSAAPRLLESGLLELEVLFCAGRPLAASHVLVRRDAHLYLFGYDPSSRRLSLGSLLIWRSLQRAAAQGRRRYDFLRGAEPYKYDWGARDRSTQRLVLARPRGS